MTSPRLLLPALVLLLGGCAAGGDLAQTAAQEEPGAESAAQAEVSKDVTVASARVERPADGELAAGDDAVLALVVSNTGRDDDQLERVTGPSFAGVAGGPWTVPGDGELTSSAQGPATVTLRGLTQGLVAGETVRLTLAFERSGDVTLTVPYPG